MANDTQFTGIINMSGLGDMLREARERKNLTLDQAQKQTRINLTILKALEEGRCDNVLNATYVKSFLKKYAEFLGLDSNQAVNHYKKLHPETETVPVSKPQRSDMPSRNTAQAVIAVKAIVTVLAIAAVIVFIGGMVAAHFKKQAPLKTAAGVRARKLSASSDALKKSPQKNAGAKRETETLIPKNVPLKLLLKVNQAVLIKMRTDGNLLFERVLSKGTAEIFSAEKTINIYAAKGEAVELILNGKALGSPGKGILKNIEITRSGVKIK